MWKRVYIHRKLPLKARRAWGTGFRGEWTGCDDGRGAQDTGIGGVTGCEGKCVWDDLAIERRGEREIERDARFGNGEEGARRGSKGRRKGEDYASERRLSFISITKTSLALWLSRPRYIGVYPNTGPSPENIISFSFSFSSPALPSSPAADINSQLLRSILSVITIV